MAVMAATRRKARGKSKKTKTPPAAKAGLFTTLADRVKKLAGGLVTRTTKKKPKAKAAPRKKAAARKKRKAPAAT